MKGILKYIVVSTLVLPAAALSGSASGHGREAPAIGLEPCKAQCGLFCPGVEYYDAFPTAPEHANFDHVHSSCNMVNCNSGACGLTLNPQSPLSRALVLVADETPGSLEKALRDHGDIVHLNWERGAVQVDGCNNQVVAHVALDQERLASLLGTKE